MPIPGGRHDTPARLRLCRKKRKVAALRVDSNIAWAKRAVDTPWTKRRDGLPKSNRRETFRGIGRLSGTAQTRLDPRDIQDETLAARGLLSLVRHEHENPSEFGRRFPADTGLAPTFPRFAYGFTDLDVAVVAAIYAYAVVLVESSSFRRVGS